jgi:hypothetical protein
MIRVFPASPAAKMPDGTVGYPETVLLRLIDSKGAPNVKVAATEDGSAVSLEGSRTPRTSRSSPGREQVPRQPTRPAVPVSGAVELPEAGRAAERGPSPPRG